MIQIIPLDFNKKRLLKTDDNYYERVYIREEIKNLTEKKE